MKFIFSIMLFFCLGVTVLADTCGCKSFSTCYSRMLQLLHEQEETYCVEQAAVGTSTLTIYLHALQEFCGSVVTVTAPSSSFDMRNLYEVIIEDKNDTNEKPIIIIDADQEAGDDAVRFCLYIIQQIVACNENEDMYKNVKWVIMPNVNPDGMEYAKYKNNGWKKNLKIDNESISFGVDVSSNFDENWGACPRVKSGFSSNYPGPTPASEKETIFIKDVLNRHKKNAKIYLSIRKNGHHIGYPFAFSNKAADKEEQLNFIAAEVASKVNIRSGGVRIFKNDTLFNLKRSSRCGHSVDYAHSIGIPWPFEYGVFLQSEADIVTMFQTLPMNYDNMLGNGYFSGLRQLYSVLTNKKKYGHLMKSTDKN